MVLRISPLAHLGVAILLVGLLPAIAAGPRWFVVLLLVPVLLSAAVVRYRTVADPDGLTARTLLGSRRVRWDELKGLRFDKGRWAVAELRDGDAVRLPAVTFATLPALAPASGGRVPNPYQNPPHRNPGEPR